MQKVVHKHVNQAKTAALAAAEASLLAAATVAAAAGYGQIYTDTGMSKHTSS